VVRVVRVLHTVASSLKVRGEIKSRVRDYFSFIRFLTFASDLVPDERRPLETESAVNPWKTS